MLIGYVRVSTAGESLELQKQALDHAGVERLFVEVACGAKAMCPQLERALAELRKGDTLVVWRLDRLARSVRHLVATVEDLDRRGIGVRSLAENIDTTTSMGKLMFHALGTAMAEVERNVLRERTEAGRAAARARGRRGGRKPKLDERKQAQAILLSKDRGKSVGYTCRKLGISRATFYRYLREESGRRPKAKTGAGDPRARGEGTRSPADGGEHGARQRSVAAEGTGISHVSPAQAPRLRPLTRP